MAESELTTVARPYARAVFAEALEEDSGLEKWSRILGFLAAAIKEPLVREGLDNPRLTTTDEADLVTGILGDELTDKGKNFVQVLAEYNRIFLLPEIATMYELFKANHEKTMDVEVISAFPVDDSEREMLAEALTRKLQREVNLSAQVDESLLGGVIVRAEDTVIDNSVRGKLNRLAQALD